MITHFSLVGFANTVHWGVPGTNQDVIRLFNLAICDL